MREALARWLVSLSAAVSTACALRSGVVTRVADGREFEARAISAEAYGAYAYDATQVIIVALAKVLANESTINDSVRQKIITEVGNVKIDGATGKVAFDKFGDTTTKVLTMYKGETKAGKQEWVPAKTDEFK